MSLATLPLPDDPTELRDLAVDLQAELARKDIEIAANAAEIHAKTLHIEKLKMQLAVLRRARFGRSSEKLDHAIEQLELLIGELEADAGAVEARDTAGDADAGQPVKRRERQHPVRKPLPPHLPRETIVKRHVDLRDKATRRFTNPVRYCDGSTGHSLVRLKGAIPPSRPGSTVGAARRCGP